jgi:hypothetical protein
VRSFRKHLCVVSTDLDRRLFPVRLPQTRTKHLYKVPMDNGRTRDAHSSAIKYLRRALSLAPDMSPALLPLVQVIFLVSQFPNFFCCVLCFSYVWSNNQLIFTIAETSFIGC